MPSPYYLIGNIYDDKRYGSKVKFLINVFLCLVLFFNLVFFVSWIVGSSYESSVVLNGNVFSKFFYFLNWNLWKKFILIGDYSTNLHNSIYLDGIVFLISLYVSIFSFCLGFISAMGLSLISVYYKQDDKKLLATFYFFPVISTFLYFLYLIHRIILYYSVRMPDIINKHSYSNSLIKINDYLNNYVNFFYSKKENMFKKDKYEMLNLPKNNCKITDLKNFQLAAQKKLLK